MNFLGQNIRYLRKQASNTQSELAALINKGQTTIGNWENGISEPSVGELLILSNYFGISLDILVKVDLSKTNARPDLAQVKSSPPGPGKSKVQYDHPLPSESMVGENEENSYHHLLREIRSLREEMEDIRSRLDSKEK